MPQQAIEIEVQAHDQASPVLSRIRESIGQLASLSASIAIGQLLADAARAGLRLAGSLAGVTGEVLMGERAIGAFLAVQEVLNSQQWENVQVGTQMVGLTKKEQEERARLEDTVRRQSTQLGLLNAQIQEQAQRVQEMTTRWTEQGLATQTAKARLADMQMRYQLLSEEYAENQARLAELIAKEKQVIPVFQRVLRGEATWEEAVERSQGRTEQLIQRMRELAVQRGIPYEAVLQMLRFGLAAGMNQEQIDSLLPGLINFGSVLNVNSERLKDAAKALADVQARGKLTGEEVRQLANATIPVFELLSKATGKSREELVRMMIEGAIPASLVLSTLGDFFGQFDQAAAGLAQTLPRALVGLQEAAKLNLAALFGPLADQLGLLVSKLRDLMASEAIQQFLAEMGQKLVAWLQPALDFIGRIAELVATRLVPAFQEAGFSGLIHEIMKWIGIPIEQRIEIWMLFGKLQEVIRDWAADVVAAIQQVWSFLAPAFQWIGGQIPSLAVALDWLKANWDAITPAIRAFLDTLLVIIGLGVIQVIIGLVLALASAFLTALPAILAFLAVFVVAWLAETGKLRQLWEGLKAWVMGALESIRLFFSQTIEQVRRLEPLIQLISAIFTGQFWRLPELWQQLQESMKGSGDASSEMKGGMEETSQVMQHMRLHALDPLSESFSHLKAQVESLPPRIPQLDTWTSQWENLLRTAGQPLPTPEPGAWPPGLTPPPPISGEIQPMAAPGASPWIADITVRVEGEVAPAASRQAAYEGVKLALAELIAAI